MKMFDAKLQSRIHLRPPVIDVVRLVIYWSSYGHSPGPIVHLPVVLYQLMLTLLLLL